MCSGAVSVLCPWGWRRSHLTYRTLFLLHSVVWCSCGEVVNQHCLCIWGSKINTNKQTRRVQYHCEVVHTRAVAFFFCPHADCVAVFWLGSRTVHVWQSHAIHNFITDIAEKTVEFLLTTFLVFSCQELLLCARWMRIAAGNEWVHGWSVQSSLAWLCLIVPCLCAALCSWLTLCTAVHLARSTASPAACNHQAIDFEWCNVLLLCFPWPLATGPFSNTTLCRWSEENTLLFHYRKY